MNLSATRQSITDALAGIGANLYWYVPETIMAPAVVIVPNADYIEPIRVTFFVGMRSNQGALDNLETLAFAALDALPAGITVGNVSQPQPVNLGQSDLLSADLTIEVTTQAS